MRRWFSFQGTMKSSKSSEDNLSSTNSTPPVGVTTTSPYGLKELYESGNAIIDLVFIHGLTGDREGTWTAQNAGSPWPKTLLPTKLPQARILTFGYNANVVDWRSLVSNNRIGDHSRNLLASLATYRENDDTNNRPIIFVAHSLGGLVCEDALLSSRNSADNHLQRILECTRGIAFLGTPHSGSGLARFAEILAKSIGLIKQTNSQILRVLESSSEVLARIQADFHTMIRARASYQPIEITCFFEELPLPGVGEVVPKHSAILAAYMSIGIHANHMNMTKFKTEDDPGFVLVVGELQRWVKLLRPMPTNLESATSASAGQSGGWHIGNNVNSNALYGSSKQTISGGFRIGSNPDI